MSVCRFATAIIAVSLFPSFSPLSSALAQSVQNPAEQGQGNPFFVAVTANRVPTAIQRTGSSITVIPRAEIERTNPASFVDVLRGVPGLTVTETGGAGAVSSVRLRGNDAQHTLVLIDGVRVNDPTGVGGDFDFSSLGTRDIERIEVLSGPQSALYGSDAIGGVINIITRRGRGKPQAYVQSEVGSYGSRSIAAGLSGSTENFSYAFAVNHIRSNGFSRFGQRIRRVEAALGKLERDPFDRTGASGRVTWRPEQGVEFELGGQISRLRTSTDNAFGSDEDTRGEDKQFSGSGYARATIAPVGGIWRHMVTLQTSITDRRSRCDVPGFSCYYNDPVDRTTFNPADRVDSGFRGFRNAVEYQGDLQLGGLGTLILGARHERERAQFSSDAVLPAFIKGFAISADRVTNSVFALHQFQLGERTDLSVGGRIDRPDDSRTFTTWRVTAAHRVLETGTKFRASIGTGAKAPSLYQQFSSYGPTVLGDPALRAERSLGYDAGIDQDLFGGRVRLSATVFENRIKDLIDFDVTRGLLNPVFFYRIGQYVNVASATTRGVELSGTAELIPSVLRARGSFAWLDARANTSFGALRNGDRLLRRPEHSGSFALTWTPTDNITIEPFVTYVGRQVDQARLQGTTGPSFRYTLPAYATLGLRAEYQIHQNLKLYARGENLTNARYQDVYNYGTAGRSVFGGLRATW